MTGRYGAFLRERFGSEVIRISIDAGFTCPNRDGTVGSAGCLYCNNKSFVPPLADRSLPVEEQIQRSLMVLPEKKRGRKIVVYFQSHTNTHAPAKRLRALYYRVLAMPGVIGIAVGTRPDCLDEAKIALFEEISRDFFVTLEIGLQSVHDRTLRAMNRGHTVSDFIECIQRIQGKRIFIGTHMILGLPGETREEILEGAHVIGAMDIDFLKLHQLQIVSGSPLATRHKVSPVKTLAYDEYLNLVCDYIERIPPRIIVQRFFSRAPQHLLLAPRWDKSDMQILKDIEISMRKRGSFQGLRCRTSFNALEISVSRSSEGS